MMFTREEWEEPRDSYPKTLDGPHAGLLFVLGESHFRLEEGRVKCFPLIPLGIWKFSLISGIYLV